MGKYNTMYWLLQNNIHIYDKYTYDKVDDFSTIDSICTFVILYWLHRQQSVIDGLEYLSG